MADSTETKALLLQISASTELLKSNLATSGHAFAASRTSLTTNTHYWRRRLSLPRRTCYQSTANRDRHHITEL